MKASILHFVSILEYLNNVVGFVLHIRKDKSIVIITTNLDFFLKLKKKWQHIIYLHCLTIGLCKILFKFFIYNRFCKNPHGMYMQMNIALLIRLLYRHIIGIKLKNKIEQYYHNSQFNQQITTCVPRIYVVRNFKVKCQFALCSFYTKIKI